jgi:DNA-directed RNA polymerase subunit RPC12/RpoP
LKTWSFLQIPHPADATTRSSLYEDVLGERYSWDSTVPNHSKVQVTDLVVIVDPISVLGFSRISKMHIEVGKKERFRCPRCQSTKISARSELLPKFRCSRCKNEFNARVSEEIDVIKYHAYFPETWHPIADLPKNLLEAAYRSKALQHSIRELDRSVVNSILGKLFTSL